MKAIREQGSEAAAKRGSHERTAILESAEERTSAIQRVSALEQQLQEARSRQEADATAHSEVKQRLDKVRQELDQERERSKSISDADSQRDQQRNELRGLRERTIDQAEQIDVLVSEISKLRKETRENGPSGSLSLAQEEISRLQSESSQLRGRMDSLKQENASLQQALERTNTALKIATAQVEEEDQDFRSPVRSLKAGHVSWGQAAGGGGPQNEPLVGTPVPSNFNARSFDDVTHALQERIVQVHLYQERADRVEGENDELRARLSESRQVEHDLHQKCKDLDTRVLGHEIEAKILAERIERLRSEKEELRLRLEEKETELRSAAQVSSVIQSKGLEKDAHVWWSYVWHELKRQHLESANLSERRVHDDQQLSGADADQMKISSLKASLSAQAIELASLRQELLGRKLSSKAEALSLREQADLSQREISRLNALIRTHGGDKEMRLAEMAVTIRSLSSRSDIHTQLASARQELEAEKITAHHLRADIDIYRSMLETEQSKAIALRKEMGQLQSMLDASSVMKTVTDVPGVEAAVLIEMMSGQLIRQQHELAKGNTSISQAQSQINMLQRSLAAEKKRSSVETAVIATRELAKGGQHRRNNKPLSSGEEMPSIPQISKQHVEENFNLEETKGESTSFQAETSFEDASSQAAVGSFSIIIDGECTPQKVLDSLDVASLTHQIHMQENCIAHLRAEVVALSAEATLSESARFHDKEQIEEAYRIDYESSSQKQELLQISLEEAKAEIATLRQENSGLEKSLVDIQISSTITGMLVPRSRSIDYGVDHETNLGDSTFIDTTDLREEHETTKALLRERTTQLKIIMETLDALHVAGIKERERENDENLFLGNLQGGNLAMLAGAPLPSVEGSWGLQSLVKRVVELTAELTSQCASASLEERRANQLEEENRRNARLLNKLRTQLRDRNETVDVMQIQIAMLSDRLKESEISRVDASSKHRNEFDELLSTLRDAETKLTTFQVTINELKQQATLSERDGCMDWMDHILSVGFPPESEQAEPTMDKDESVRDMVAALVQEWKLSAASQPQQPSKGRMSKSEQRFMQKVADLVSESSRICNKAVLSLHQAQIQKDQAQRRSTVISEKLKAALIYLHQSKNRTHALEHIVRNDSRSSITQCEHLKSFLRKSMLDERRNSAEARRMLILERRDQKLQEMKKSADAKKVFSLQQRIAELESRGSATLRGRDEATAALEGRVKNAEESMHRWFKTELPRLISGLPLTEDTMGNFEVDSGGGQCLSNESYLGTTSPGLDRTFALAQALCCSKASSTVQDMKLAGALEKNSILKSRVIELESVLTRWKDDIHEAGLAVEHSKGLGLALNAQQRENALYASADAEGALLDRNKQLTSKLVELEEENVITAGRLEHSLQRNEELKKLIDSIMQQEESSKVKMSKSVSQIRSNLEQEHARELRHIREAYECDKKDLMDQLEIVLETVDSPRALRVVRPSDKPVQTHPTQSSVASCDFVSTEGAEMNENAGMDDMPFSSGEPSSEVGARIRSLLTQLSGSSPTSQRFYSQQPPTADHATEDVSAALDSSRMQGEIRALENALESERARYRDARAEISELEQLLTAQRNAFSERVQGSPVLSPIQSGSRGESPDSTPAHHVRLDRTLSSDVVKITLPVHSQEEVKPPYVGGSSPGEDKMNLRSLLEQVQVLETRLSAEKVPESSVVLLRELRSRVSEMESSMREGVDRQQANWEQERKALNQALLESSTLLESLRAGQEEVSSSIRRRYEDALSQAQDALEQQTTAASDHVSKMEEFVRGSQAQSDYQKEQLVILTEQIAMKEASLTQMSATIKSQQAEILSLQQQSNMERSQIDSISFPITAPHLHVPPPHAPVVVVSDSKLANSSLEELIKLQRLLDRTSDDLERSNKRLRDVEDKHAKEIAVLISQCNKLKREVSMRAVKTLKPVASDQAAPSSRPVVSKPDANERTRDLEEQLRRMDYRFRMKTAELDAIVASLAKTGGISTVDGSFLYGDGSAEDESSLPSSFADVSSLPIGMKHQIVEARLQAAEGEVETLQSLLSKERRESFLALKLQKLATATRPQTARQDLRGKKEVDPEPQTPSRSRTPLKQKEQRATTPQKSPRRGDDSSKSAGGPPKDETIVEKERVLNEEISTLRLQLSEARTQVQTLRDDLVRKSRLIASLKAARQAEGSSADHWRAEAQNHEETSKRLQRSVSSKDAIIKDLRSKIGLQNTDENERDNAGHPAQTASSSEGGQQPPADLKSRLKAAEVERSRARSRLSVIRDRLSEAEIEIKELKEENVQLTKACEKAESLRISLARKEAQCRSLKSQAEQQKVVYDATLLEAENKTR